MFGSQKLSKRYKDVPYTSSIPPHTHKHIFARFSITESINLWPETLLETLVILRLLPLMTWWSTDFQVNWYSKSAWTLRRKRSTALFFVPHPFSLICLPSCDYCHLIVQLLPTDNYSCCNDYEKNRKVNTMYSVQSIIRTIILRLPLETIAE